MLSLEQLILLALIQGLTEFLPISSSAHLILPSEILGWPDQGPLIDLSVHLGSLFAVMLYFRTETAGLVRGGIDTLRVRFTPESRLFLQLALATVPVLIFAAILVGLDLVDSLRSAQLIGWTSILFGLLLLEADRIGLNVKRIDAMTFKGALILGLFQMIALLPGVSRSGITMTGGRFLGYERGEAARFSMLMAIPVILIMGSVAALDVVGSDAAGLRRDALVAGALSFVSAYAAIGAFMALVRKVGFLPFVLYRIVLGAGLLVYVYGFAG
ncbi:MAG: undecaprenyl-diphosphate phosphatase [Alphaproteobacteria bacterium]|nr:undecaprenyl-diphosphate phosphatase [Alphaproteobacteria bacterium]